MAIITIKLIIRSKSKGAQLLNKLERLSEEFLIIRTKR